MVTPPLQLLPADHHSTRRIPRPSSAAWSTPTCLTNTVIAIPFPLTDDHTVATSLTPSITTSSNSTLIPNDVAHLSITGSGTNRVLNITPAANVSGAAPLYISVTDGGGATLLKTVIVEVRPNTNVMLIDNFDYDNSGSIINVSGGLWANHSGTAGQLQVTSGVAVIDSKAHSEDVNAPLIGAAVSDEYGHQRDLVCQLHAERHRAAMLPPDAYITHFKDNTTFDLLRTECGSRSPMRLRAITASALATAAFPAT